MPDTALAQPELVSPTHPLALSTASPPERHPVAVYLAHLAPGSRRVMRGALDAIASILTVGCSDALTLDWAALRYQHTAAVRAVLASGRYAPATANRHLAALRGVLRECWRLGSVDIEDYQRAARRRTPLQETRARRNYVLLRLLYTAGLRIDEIARLAWRDLRERDDAGQVTA